MLIPVAALAERRPATDQAFQHFQFCVAVVDDTGVDHHRQRRIPVDIHRMVVMLGLDVLDVARVGDRDQIGSTVAQTEVNTVVFSFDIAAGAANADGDGPIDL